MLIDGPDHIFFADRDNSIFQVHGVQFFHRKEPDRHLSSTLLDGVSRPKISVRPGLTT